MTKKITIKRGRVQVKSQRQHRLLHGRHLPHTHQTTKGGKTRYKRHY